MCTVKCATVYSTESRWFMVTFTSTEVHNTYWTWRPILLLKFHNQGERSSRPSNFSNQTKPQVLEILITISVFKQTKNMGASWPQCRLATTSMFESRRRTHAPSPRNQKWLVCFANFKSFSHVCEFFQFHSQLFNIQLNLFWTHCLLNFILI